MQALRRLSPHRRPTGPAKAHDGSLQTKQPDVMWATDGAQVETVREGVRRHCGALGAAVPRGLSVRSDHGSQYTASWFRAELQFLEITPSMALVGEPETNGIAERFILTLKEQVIHGRVYEEIEALRRAVDDFVAGYNAHWRLEKNKFRSPDEVRADFDAARLTEAA